MRREALLQLETSSDLSTSCLSDHTPHRSSPCRTCKDPPTAGYGQLPMDSLPRSPPVLGRYRSASTGSLGGTPTRLPPLVREDSSGSMESTVTATSASSKGGKGRFTQSAPSLTMSLLPRREGRRRKAGGWALGPESTADFMLDTHPAALVERAAYRRHMEAQQAAAQQRE